jgi:hypothetical protein
MVPPNSALLSSAFHGSLLFHTCGVPSFDTVALALTTQPSCESWHSQILKDIVVRVRTDALFNLKNKNFAFDLIAHFRT